ncbi:hypothetical protein ACW9HR_21925 [Nocardia gipuzkoensis]
MSDTSGESAVPGMYSPPSPNWPEPDELAALSPEAFGPADVAETDYTTWLPHPAPPASTDTDAEPPVDRHNPSAAIGRTGARPRRGPVVAVLSVTGVAAVIGAGIWVWPAETVPKAAPPPSAVTSPATAAPPASPTASTAWCEHRSAPERVSGNGVGSTFSGPEVILALEYSYYSRRDATAVRTLLAPDGRFGTDAEIQAGIDSIPTGTTHCVEITPAGPDRWAVAVTERWPNDSRAVHRQTISTVTREDRTLVFAVEPA